MYSNFVINSYGSSPGIHLVKNHESQLKKQGAMLGPLCNQTVNTGGRCQNTIFQSTEIKYSPSIYLELKKDYKTNMPL